VHAHDDPNGRADALINLGRLCRKVHQYTTALHAFKASLALTTLPRLQLPALGGAILTASVLGDDATVDALSGVAERLAGAGEPVYECAAAWFDLATAAMTREAFAAADRYLRAARAITVPRGFHELTWQLDAMAEQLAARAGARRPGESLAARASNETTGRQEPTGDAALRLDPASSSVLAEIRALPIGDTLAAVLART
jgi:hypothetical protein